MKKDILKTVTVGVLTLGMVVAFAGCGNSGGAASSSKAAGSSAASSAAASTAAASTAAASSAASSAAASSAASSSAQSEGKFESADGWSVQYEKSVIQANKIDEHSASFVYTGDCAGSCLVTITYLPGKKLTDANDEYIKKIADNIKDVDKSESTFPGTTDKKGIWLSTSTKEGVPTATTVILGEYKDGVLVLENFETLSGKEEIDMPISDAFGEIVNSIKYN